MNKAEKHYIFGYGSLINSLSREVTGDTGIAVPVKVAGYTRHWAKITEGFGMSSVVVVPSDQASLCNGVLVEVDESEFPSFDERENGYDRVLVEPDALSFYRSEDSDVVKKDDSQVKIWVYQTGHVVNPCQSFPVVLSYLDVILAGCLEYSVDFCRDFLEMTKGWEYSVLNDRPVPRYPRVQKDLNTEQLNDYIAQACGLDAIALKQSYS